MKSFTQNPSSIQGLRADKRFDALVKQEMIEHQHIISCHHQEMQTIRDALHMAMEKFDSLFEHSVNELKDFKTYSVCTIGVLQQKVASHETTIQEQKKTIEALHGQLLGFQDDCATRVDVEKLRKSLAQEVKANTEINLGSFQLFQREFKILIHGLENDLAKLRCEIEQKLSLLTDKTDSNFYVSRIDKDGVLKEIRVYDKTIFIIEKKIENLYTLIERINKRGELCHKPE